MLSGENEARGGIFKAKSGSERCIFRSQNRCGALDKYLGSRSINKHVGLKSKSGKKLLPLNKIKTVVNAVENAFGDYGRGVVQMPPKAYLYFTEHNGDLRIMPSYSSALKMAATKIVNVHPQNPKKGLNTVMASILLNDPRTGLPVALMDGTYITAMRTGAAGASQQNILRAKMQNARRYWRRCASDLPDCRNSKSTRVDCALLFMISTQKVLMPCKKRWQKKDIKTEAGSIEEAAGQDIVVTVTPVRSQSSNVNGLKRERISTPLGLMLKAKRSLTRQF